jgi:hypothetical protein
MAKELKNPNDTNREQVELFLQSEPGAVELNEKQKELYIRWEFVDEAIRKQEVRKRETLAQMVMVRFKVSRTTAYQDIVNAEHVFASSAPLNKKYRTQQRIEFLETKIDELFEAGENIAAAMLEKTLQKYYEKYPDITPLRSPKRSCSTFKTIYCRPHPCQLMMLCRRLQK